ncbi:MAG: DUF1365 domain-containing protein [Planctomycetes bacterium]|nr:DUF1365 domain-containing protein [Planctomycetota bacterium]
MNGASALYEGRVTHRRLEPGGHGFAYRVFLLYLDLGELDALTRAVGPFSHRGPAPVRFRRADYLGPAERPLDEAARDVVEARLGRRPAGPVRLLTHARTWGYVFNPVSFYYCHDGDGALDAIVAEITNTPWGERHAYVLDARQDAAPGARARFAKAFHVSPFQPLEQQYAWRFGAPGASLRVDMTNLDAAGARFHATLALRRRPLTTRGLLGALARHPFLTHRVWLAIYAQAARLYLGRAPFHVHPAKRAGAASAGDPA